ncbi:TIGR01244 family protein [Porphyrobacter sp. HT-58-2]|uniref:TIGR01244 family sulfur transferase n=1 Tax=Porphyrobacter sp. HT-58-2 TaxID=2023229 RepID=UPI000CDC3C38|nr:TIGR01244 family sulfur transferase [Porphyrobacter sp. HT-58-2]AUX70427.1 TIGR01244 family protein [Porphyrobacter sp. HT-58-2]
MELKVIDDTLAVAAQMQPEELAALAGEGFVAVICNRPDGEEPGQPMLDDMRAAAQAAGLAFHHIPVSGGLFPPASVAAFGAIRRGTQGKVLAYCRTGTRAATLDALANVHGLSVPERLNRAAAAGYDLSALADRMNSAA